MMNCYEEAELDALSKYPECKFARATNGINAMLGMTVVVELWRNEECYLADDPPRRIVEGYPFRRYDGKEG